jgi:hypothetical protein
VEVGVDAGHSKHLTYRLLTFMRLQAPLLYSELFKGLVLHTLPKNLEDWDNMSRDETVPDVASLDCAKACTIMRTASNRFTMGTSVPGNKTHYIRREALF